MKNNKFYVKVLVGISLVLVFVWFRKGVFVAGGEEGLWFYDYSRSLELFGKGWVEFGVGTVAPAFIPKLPLIYVAAVLQKFISGWFLQAGWFFGLLVSGALGVFYLSRRFFRRFPASTSFYVAVFYLFNVFTMTQVWSRNIHAGIFAWSYLPVLFVLGVLWVNTGKLRYLLATAVSCLFFASAFVTISFLFTVWLPVLVYFVFWAVFKRKVKLIVRMVVFGVAWLLFSAWWVYPFFTLSQETLGGSENYVDFSFNSLIGVSQYFPTGQLILLRQAFYFSTLDSARDLFWADFYNTPFVYGINILILVLVSSGLLYSFRKKLKVRFFIVALFGIGWFLSKGVNPPLGYSFYQFLFQNYPFLMAFRNPWEKLGILFLLPYSLMFGLGIYSLSSALQRYKNFLISVTLFLACFALVWPMWTGHVFPDSAKLKIPDYYEKANILLKKDYQEGKRILLLPLRLGDSSIHTWKYKGVSPYAYLFDMPVISGPIDGGNENYLRILGSLERFDPFILKSELDDLAIGYVIIDESVILEEGRVQIIEGLSSFVESNEDFEFLDKVGDLMIYKYNSNENSIVTATGGQAPEVSVLKINPARYKVQVRGAQEPYELVFKSGFNTRWAASIEGSFLTGHKRAFGYANVWEVDKVGNYEVDLFFRMWPWE